MDQPSSEIALAILGGHFAVTAQPAYALHKGQHLTARLGRRSDRHRAARAHDDVNTGKLRAVQTKRFAHEPFAEISRYCEWHKALVDRDAEARGSAGGRSGIDLEKLTRGRTLEGEYRCKRMPPRKPADPGKRKTVARSRQTPRRARPFARRERRTARPARVFMRTRNP